MLTEKPDEGHWRQAAAALMWCAALLPIAIFLTLGNGIEGDKRPWVGFTVQLIGTAYWSQRVMGRAGWMGGFIVNDESSSFDRVFFGAVAALAIGAGFLMSVFAQW